MLHSCVSIRLKPNSIRCLHEGCNSFRIEFEPCARGHNIPMEEVRRKNERETHENLERLTRTGTKCPRCGTWVQRRSGCDHMNCPNCKTEFCIVCGEKSRGSDCRHKRAGNKYEIRSRRLRLLETMEQAGSSKVGRQQEEEIDWNLEKEAFGYDFSNSDKQLSRCQIM